VPLSARGHGAKNIGPKGASCSPPPAFSLQPPARQIKPARREKWGWFVECEACGAPGRIFKPETRATVVSAQIKLALWLYGLGLVSMLSFSALFNTVGWRTSWSSVLVCLDRAFIFVMIAGTFTPIVAINLQVCALLAVCPLPVQNAADS